MALEVLVKVGSGRRFSLEQLVDDALRDCGYVGTSQELMALLHRDTALLAAMQRLVFCAMRGSQEVKHGG